MYPLYIYRLINFDKFLHSRNHNHNQDTEQLYHSKKDSCVASQPFSSQSQATFNLLSDYTSFACSRIFYKGNNNKCSIVFLLLSEIFLRFTCVVVSIYSLLNQSIVPLCECFTVYLFTSWRTFRLFLETFMYRFLCERKFPFLSGKYLRNRISGSYDKCV